MRARVLFVCAFLAVVGLAETIGEQIDPSIPKDKCGVVIGINEDESTELFILGADKAYYHKYEKTDGSWSDWVSLGGNFKGGPSVVHSGEGRLVVYGRGIDNRIWFKHQIEPSSSVWTVWESLDSKVTSDPVAVLSSEGLIHVFARGADNSLMHRIQYSNVTLVTLSEGTSLGGSLTSQPAVMLDAEGMLHIFVRGPDRALWHKHQIGDQEPRLVKWSEWQSLGGVLASAPRVPVTINTVNLLDVFVRASDKAYWHRSQIASIPTDERQLDWSEWQTLGGVFSSGPSTLINGEGLLEAYGRGADKAIWRKSQYVLDGVTRWTAWTTLRGITSTGPAVRVRSDGLPDVYVRGVDKQIWVKSQAFSNNGTTLHFAEWKSLDNSVLAEAFAC